MNYQQALELVRDKAASKYHKTKLHMLQKLTKSLYKERDKGGDVEKRVITKKIDTMCGWAGITERQLRTVLSEIEEVHVESWENGTVSYTMNLEPLRSAEKTVDQVKRLKKEKNADRAAKAREAYNDQRIDASYKEVLGAVSLATAPAQETLAQHFLQGREGPTTPEQKAAFDRMAAAKREKDDAAEAVREYDEYKDKHGRKAADEYFARIKRELLKDVKDQNLKRMMMRWSVGRIARAKKNAEKISNGVSQ